MKICRAAYRSKIISQVQDLQCTFLRVEQCSVISIGSFGFLIHLVLLIAAAVGVNLKEKTYFSSRHRKNLMVR